MSAMVLWGKKKDATHCKFSLSQGRASPSRRIVVQNGTLKGPTESAGTGRSLVREKEPDVRR